MFQRGQMAPFFPNDQRFCYPLSGYQVNNTFTLLQKGEGVGPFDALNSSAFSAV